MSQTPHPHDPFATEPGTPGAPQPPQADPQPPQSEQGAPTSDPHLHPHDPYAYDADAAGSDPLDIDADPAPQAAQQPAPAQQAPAPQPAPGGQDPYAASGAAPYAAQAPHAQQAPHGQGTAGGATTVPAALKGVYEGPLSGQPTSESDSRMWSLFAHLSAVVGYIIGVGFLGWLGPLIIFLVYKDRDRFVRYNAAEALNAAIAVVIASIALWIVVGVVGVLTLGFGFILSPIAYAPAVVHVVFAIIGAVKSNQGTWWNYPVNIRLVK